MSHGTHLWYITAVGFKQECEEPHVVVIMKMLDLKEKKAE